MLHYLDVRDEVCKRRLHQRNRSGGHAFAATDAQFARIAKHFAAPSTEEGFNIVRYPFEHVECAPPEDRATRSTRPE